MLCDASCNGEVIVDTDDQLTGEVYSSVSGCTDSAASNYDAAATIDDGSCITYPAGCTDPTASNYNPAATIDDGSCVAGPAQGSLSGTVTDQGSSEAISGANVLVGTKTDTTYTPTSNTVTDIAGSYSFAGIATGSNYYLEVSSTGYQTKIMENIMVSSTVNIELEVVNAAGRASAPTADPASTSFTTDTTVTLSAESGDTIYYVVNGSTDTTRYDSVIFIDTTRTLKFWAQNAPKTRSNVITETYTLAEAAADVTQNIPLEQGWNTISLNVQPGNMTPDSVLSGINDLLLLKDGSSKTYWPDLGINEINSLKNTAGYQIYMRNTNTLTVTAAPIDAASTPVSLNAGWNLIAYLSQNAMAVETALRSIADDITLVSAPGGKIYWPDSSINTITNMQPGQGYKIHMKKAATLTYPAAGAKRAASFSAKSPLPDPIHFSLDLNTGNNAFILCKKVSAGGIKAADGSEVGAFDESGNLIGSGTVKNGLAAFSIWGDDPMTRIKDGAEQNENLTFKLWSEGIEYSLKPVSGNSVVFGTDKIIQEQFTVSPKVTGKNISIDKMGPNPFVNNVQIKFSVPFTSESEVVAVNIYDLNGNFIRQITGTFSRSRSHEIIWNGRDKDNVEVKPGTYIVNISGADFKSSLKVIRL